jgi:Fe-S-cluster containining protein
MIDCTKCPDKAGCCGILIFEKEFMEKFGDKLQGKPEKKIEKGSSVVYLYDDCRCPFLDRVKLRCAIYEDRPEICRKYGTGEDARILCPYFKPNGNPWSEAKKKQLERIRNHMIDNVVKEATNGR